MTDVKQYIFFDFEMLCSDRGMPYEKMEGIRLGAVKYDIRSNTTMYFDRFIKPQSKKPLSSFCKELTGIKDCDLINADEFKHVFEDFLTWVGGIKRSRFFSWSSSDLTRLKIDSESNDIPFTTINKIEKRYIDFQAIFTKRVSKNNPSVENALQLYGLSFIGDAHNPMHDAYNTLRIYLTFLHEPLRTDKIMLKQFIFENVPDEPKLINRKVANALQKDMSQFKENLKEFYHLKDAYKMIKKTKQMVRKYENILINRSGLFSNENVEKIKYLVEFYHDLLVSYHEHSSYSSKIMILDESILSPLNEVL
ncbi:exonuclease domain-containing protein [Evansella sp. AB-P1]|uniref:3'-5' exonuclease n=1 Tax=Evansella sp. AB-P1 TaxID=3037653 RepID=UPI00241CA973|nr:3'-5' exonuclease [Evansella sp. AB-P1]MDG5789547.1 exonuclease domain-containing protein [Evansella sp. AB-P1]